MNWIFVVLIALQLACTQARPADDFVEIEKQRLVKFPEETSRIQENEQKTFEAKRILEEIDKINVALGYVKRQDPSLPSILDSNQFLFPKPAYHPFHSQSSDGGILQPSIRSLSPYSNRFPYQNSKSSPKPKLYFYYYQPETQQSTDEVPIEKAPSKKDEYETIKNNPRTLKLIDYKVVGDFQDAQDSKTQKLTEPKLRLYFVPRELKVNEKSMDYLKNEKLIKIEKLPTIRPFSKTTSDKQKANSKTQNFQKYVTAPTTTTTTTTTQAPPVASFKTPLGLLFNRPGHVIAQKVQKVEHKPVLQSVPLASPQYNQQQQQQFRPDAISSDDYKWDMDSSEENDYPQDYEKHIFSAKRKEMQMAEVQKEALKESGIIIQRLKVRKGGIAIAGPGGVATAGSGGTAIVGPGGYALTHPRSLTIAGPGAKVIAVPESTDLKDAIQRTNSGRSYADIGEVVATGPVIYYSPDNNSQF